MGIKNSAINTQTGSKQCNKHTKEEENRAINTQTGSKTAQ